MAKRSKSKKSGHRKASTRSTIKKPHLEGVGSRGDTASSDSYPSRPAASISSPSENEAIPLAAPGAYSDRFWGLILLIAVILVYSPVWWAGFIWDDDNNVTANPVIIGPQGFKDIWISSAAQFYPLTLTTFWVEHVMWGLAPLPYHLANVVMHGACAVVLWRVLRDLQVPAAWLGAALWALHPVQVESVAWITETMNTQSGLFFLLSILFFLKRLSCRNRVEQTGDRWNYALTLLFAALAMASKSSTVILPFVLCLCAWWVEGRWYWRNLAKVGPILFMSACSAGLALFTVDLQGGAFDARTVPSGPERLVIAGRAVWFYLGKIIWPHPLITTYPRWEIDSSQWLSYLPLLGVIAVLFILWLERESWSRPFFFAFAYFLMALVPVLGFVNHLILRYSFVFDHFQYLASIGPLALAGVGMARFSGFIPSGKRYLQPALCTGLLLILGVLSWQRAWAYESEETLWTDTVAKNPNSWEGYSNLAALISQQGQLDKGMLFCRKALAINPRDAGAHNNLGQMLFQKGKLDEAMAEFHLAIELDPDEADAHYNLGNVLSQKGELDDAVMEYRNALAINPNFASAANNLGDVLSRKGQVDEEMDQFQKALASNPNNDVFRNNLGNALLIKGKTDAAISQFEKALEINPQYALAHNGLGNALAQKGQLNEAMAQYQEALKIDANYAQAHNGLGGVLALEGQLNAAADQFREALRLNPDYGNARDNLAAAEALIRKKSDPK